VVKVVALASRRGPAPEARGLYLDITEADPTPPLAIDTHAGHTAAREED
jgi:hypothetical protein